MDWFLHDNGLRHERVKQVPGKRITITTIIIKIKVIILISLKLGNTGLISSEGQSCLMVWRIPFSFGMQSFQRWCLGKNTDVEALQNPPTVYGFIMYIKRVETNNVNESRLAEEGPSSGRCSRQWNIGCHHANPVISKRRQRSSQENNIVIECCLLSEQNVRGYRKRMLSLWLNKGKFWGY